VKLELKKYLDGGARLFVLLAVIEVDWAPCRIGSSGS
jgi:hypothetical protein